MPVESVTKDEVIKLISFEPKNLAMRRDQAAAAFLFYRECKLVPL